MKTQKVWYWLHSTQFKYFTKKKELVSKVYISLCVCFFRTFRCWNVQLEISWILLNDKSSSCNPSWPRKLLAEIVLMLFFDKSGKIECVTKWHSIKFFLFGQNLHWLMICYAYLIYANFEHPKMNGYQSIEYMHH